LAEPRAQVTRALEAERTSQARANKTAVDNARQKKREKNELVAERKRRKKEAADYAANEKREAEKLENLNQQAYTTESSFLKGEATFEKRQTLKDESEAKAQRKQTVGDAIAFQ